MVGITSFRWSNSSCFLTSRSIIGFFFVQVSYTFIKNNKICYTRWNSIYKSFPKYHINYHEIYTVRKNMYTIIYLFAFCQCKETNTYRLQQQSSLVCLLQLQIYRLSTKLSPWHIEVQKKSKFLNEQIQHHTMYNQNLKQWQIPYCKNQKVTTKEATVATKAIQILKRNSKENKKYKRN